MATITYSDKLTVLACGDCAIPFAIPEDLYRRKYRDGTAFWCPNGHKVSYGETENQRLKRDLANAEAQRDRARAQTIAARDQADAAERSARAYKGVATRVKNRAANGVCPAPGCKRSFKDLARHMAGQHPDFVDAHGGAGHGA